MKNPYVKWRVKSEKSNGLSEDTARKECWATPNQTSCSRFAQAILFTSSHVLMFSCLSKNHVLLFSCLPKKHVLLFSCLPKTMFSCSHVFPKTMFSCSHVSPKPCSSVLMSPQKPCSSVLMSSKKPCSLVFFYQIDTNQYLIVYIWYINCLILLFIVINTYRGG